MKRGLESNIWKTFIYILTQRRNFIPLLSIFFLTLPNTSAKQIGLYTGIGWIASFIFEIPSGYLSDTFGHKKTLILAKIFMVVSTLSFIFANSLSYFIAGSIFISLGFAFSSGTINAFFHNTLINLKKEKQYSKIFGKIGANASIISAILILTLPLFTKISIIFPFKIYLGLDLIGLFVSFTYVNPKIKISAQEEEPIPLRKQLKQFFGTGFYNTSIFLGLVGGFIISLSTFKEPYLQSIGFPIIFIGSVMALSRVIWFILGHNIKRIKRFSIKKIFIFECIFFPLTLILMAILNQPYLSGILFAISLGYFHARRPIMEEFYLEKFCINKKYKATMLSIKTQFGKLFEAIIVFFAGFLMAKSYQTGYLVFGGILFVLLRITYISLKKYLK